MLTKEQKIEQVKQAEALIQKNQTLLFADFTGVPTKALRSLKEELRKSQGGFKVFKKRLLNIAFKNLGIGFDPLQWKSQVGVVFLSSELSEQAATIYKIVKTLAKDKIEFKILGGYNLSGKKAVSAEEFVVIAKLPSREMLLAMLVSVIAGPLRSIMYVLGERGKKMVETTQ